MWSIFVQRRLSLLLGMLFFAGSVLPPGIHHCHANDHQVADQGEHHYQCEHTPKEVQFDVPHFHIHVLGWSFLLPVNCPFSDDDEHEYHDKWFCVTPSLANDLKTLQFSDVQQSSHPLRTTSNVLVTLQSDLRHVAPVLFAPLCDSARLECSGVRLI